MAKKTKQHRRSSSKQPFLKLYREGLQATKAVKRTHPVVSGYVKLLERIQRSYDRALGPVVEGSARAELRAQVIYPLSVLKLRPDAVKELVTDTKAVLKQLRTFDSKLAKAVAKDRKAELVAKENTKKAKKLAKVAEREAKKAAKKAEREAVKQAKRDALKAQRETPGGLLVNVLVGDAAKTTLAFEKVPPPKAPPAPAPAPAKAPEQVTIDELLGRKTPEQVAKDVTAQAVASVDAMNAALRASGLAPRSEFPVSTVLISGQERAGKTPSAPPPPPAVAMPGNNITNLTEEPDFDDGELTETPF